MCALQFALYLMLITGVTFTSLAMGVERARRSFELGYDYAHAATTRPRRVYLAVAVALAVAQGVYTVASVMAAADDWTARIPVCVCRFVNDTPGQRVFLLLTMIAEGECASCVLWSAVCSVLLWRYIKRTSAAVSAKFRVVGHHQSLHTRTTLKRNLEAARSLYPAFVLHALFTGSSVLIYLVAMQLTDVARDDASVIVRCLARATATRMQLKRETLGLALRVLQYVYSVVYVLVICRQYDLVFARLLAIMPRTARCLGGKARRTVAPQHGSQQDVEPDQQYWQELQQMWHAQ